MPFQLAQPELASGLKAGDTVLFRFRQQGDDNVVTAHSAQRSRRGRQAMIARLIRWSVGNRFLVLLATVFLAGLGRVGAAHHADRCAARPVRRAGDHPHQLPGPGAADRREPGHLSAGDDDAVGARRQDGARLLVLRRQLRLRAVRRRHRPVLGALARARVPEPGAGPPAGGAKTSLGPDATGVGWIFQYALVDRSGRNDLSQLRALAGLVPEVRAEDACPTWPRSPASAAWCARCRWCSTRPSSRPTA